MKKFLFTIMLVSSPLSAEERGIIYILTNPTINVKKEKVIKIGQSKDTNTMEKRRSDPSRKSAAAEPFEIYYYAEINNYINVEKEIQDYPDAYRINKKREFFQIDPEKAKMILIGLQLAEGQKVQPAEKIKKEKNIK